MAGLDGHPALNLGRGLGRAGGRMEADQGERAFWPVRGGHAAVAAVQPCPRLDSFRPEAVIHANASNDF